MSESSSYDDQPKMIKKVLSRQASEGLGNKIDCKVFGSVNADESDEEDSEQQMQNDQKTNAEFFNKSFDSFAIPDFPDQQILQQPSDVEDHQLSLSIPSSRNSIVSSPTHSTKGFFVEKSSHSRVVTSSKNLSRQQSTTKSKMPPEAVEVASIADITGYNDNSFQQPSSMSQHDADSMATEIAQLSHEKSLEERFDRCDGPVAVEFGCSSQQNTVVRVASSLPSVRRKGFVLSQTDPGDTEDIRVAPGALSRESFVGAFHAGGRAFGERPAWAVTTRNENSVPQFRSRSTFNSHYTSTRSTMTHQFDEVFHTSRRIISQVSTQWHYIVEERTCSCLDKASMKSSSSMLMAFVFILVIIAGVTISLAQINNSDGNNTSPPTGIICEFGKVVNWIAEGQPDFRYQCECQGYISEISDSTKMHYNNLKEAVEQKLYSRDSQRQNTTRAIQMDKGYTMIQRNTEESLDEHKAHYSYSPSSSSSRISTLESIKDAKNFSLNNKVYKSDCGDSRDLALLEQASKGAYDLESYAMKVLFQEMKIPVERWTTLWGEQNETLNSTAPVYCDWFGVVCQRENEKYKVTEMNLTDFHPIGTLPDEIGLLSDLTDLDLTSSLLLSGTIPSQIGLLSNLETLALIECPSLHGDMPSEIGRMISLENLAITNSKQGLRIIPSDIGVLNNLTSLNLKNNNLSELPSQLFALGSLRALNLKMNKLTGSIMDGIGSLTSLEELLLGGNNFESVYLPSLFIWSLKELTTLDMSDLKLKGSIPTYGLQALSSLVSLDLKQNQITGTIPSTVALLTKLEHLTLSENSLSGPIPTEIGQLNQSLSHLDLFFNSLTGSVPMGLNQLSDLEFMDLRENQLAGSIDWLCDLVANKEPRSVFFMPIDKECFATRFDCSRINCSCCNNVWYP